MNRWLAVLLVAMVAFSVALVVIAGGWAWQRYGRPEPLHTTGRPATPTHADGPPALSTPATAITQASDGYFVVSLDQAGAIDYTDPGDGAWAVMPMANEAHKCIHGDAIWALVTKFYEHQSSPFGASDDAWMVHGICTETDLHSATVDGFFWGLVYTGGARLVRVGYMLNGADTVATDAAGSGTLAGGGGAGSLIHLGGKNHRVVALGLTSAGAISASDFATTLGGFLTMGSTDIYSFVAFGRTNNTNANTVTGGMRSRQWGSRLLRDGLSNA